MLWNHQIRNWWLLGLQRFMGSVTAAMEASVRTQLGDGAKNANANPAFGLKISKTNGELATMPVAKAPPISTARALSLMVLRDTLHSKKFGDPSIATMALSVIHGGASAKAAIATLGTGERR